MVHYFDEARVQQLLSVPDLLQGVREALVALTLGQVVQPLRMVMPIGEASNNGLLFLKPAQLGDALSTKLITLVPGNAQKGLPTLLSTIVLMDPATGQTLAVMEGNTITAMRTAAASAVAADALVPRTPQVVAMLKCCGPCAPCPRSACGAPQPRTRSSALATSVAWPAPAPKKRCAAPILCAQ